MPFAAHRSFRPVLVVSLGQVKPGVQSEDLLLKDLVLPLSKSRVDQKVPAVLGNRGGHEDEGVRAEQAVTKQLLPPAWYARCQPVGIRNLVLIECVDVIRAENPRRGQHVWNGVQGSKPFVHGDLQNRGGRIDAAVHGLHAFGVPAATAYLGADPAVPGVDVPLSGDDLAASSWLVPRIGFGFHGFAMGTVVGVFALISIVFTGRPVFGVSLGVLGCMMALGTSEYGALRLGILNGDAKIGCYNYAALECRTMLSVSGAESMYVAERDAAKWDERFAAWYQPGRQTHQDAVESTLPSTMPGLALMQSPLMLARLSELQVRVADQRAETASFKQAMAK